MISFQLYYAIDFGAISDTLGKQNGPATSKPLWGYT